jgi:hypothetical protein
MGTSARASGAVQLAVAGDAARHNLREAELRDHILHLFLSSSADQRWHAWRTLNLCFPEIGETLANINPLQPSSSDSVAKLSGRAETLGKVTTAQTDAPAPLGPK